MKKMTRRLTAAVLSACLALSPLCAFAEPITAQVELPLMDGSTMPLSVQTVVTSAGETVYWLDMSMLTEEQLEALYDAQLMLFDESGEVLGQYLFSDLEEGVIELYDAIDPEITVPMMLSPVAMPESMEEAESILAEYGFAGSYDSDDEAARLEAERLAAEEAARLEAERLAAEEAARLEAERLAAEEAARLEAERLAAEEAARLEAERLAAEEAARLEAERLAAEEASRLEAERLAAEEAARLEAERLAAEEAARLEAERLAAEEAARLEAERLAAEEAARLEAERLAAEEAARLEAERLAAEEAARLEEEMNNAQPDFDEIIQNIVVPSYVFPYQDKTNLRAEPLKDADNVLMQVNVNDILIVSGHAVDGEGNVWWQATDYRTGVFGFIMADVTAQLDEQAFAASAQIIDAEKASAQQKAEEERLAAEQVELDRLAAEQAELDRIAAAEEEAAAKAEEERLAAEQAELDRLAAEAEAAAKAEADRIAAETAAKLEEERLAAEAAAKAEAERIAAEAAAKAEADRLAAEQAQQQAAVRYAITSNRNGDQTNNLRAEPDSKSDIVNVYNNGELLIWEAPTDDGKWYPVTVVRDGAKGYMRDYLMTEISETDAQARMADILADKADDIQPEEPADDVDDAADVAPDTEADVTSDPVVDENADVTEIPEEIPSEPTVTEAPADTTIAFPAFAMTLPQENNAAIVLREEPAGGMPQSGAVPMISAPTPLEVLDAKTDATGNLWYLVRNMNNGDTGYLEAVKTEEITKEQAEQSILPPTDVLPPVPSDNENIQPEQPQEPDEDDTNDTTEDEPEITEPELPDTPQELTEGDIYHYGRNTGKQVALRESPNSNGKLQYRMEAGTVLWVMSMDGEWCHVRTDRGEGYVMAKFVELMDVREEQNYVSTLDDPEIAPEQQPEADEPEADEPEDSEPAETEQPEPTATPEPTAEPTATPDKNAKPTATPAPQDLEIYAVVTTDNTQLRSNPTMNAYLQAEIAEDSVVYAMRTEMNENGEMWTLVQTDNQWGYVLADNIRLMSEEEQSSYLAELEASKATPTPTLEPTATPEPTTTPEPMRLDIYARVINDGTPLRGNPDPNAYLQNILDKETVVFLFQSQVAADGMSWYLVQHSGQWGYIRADLVRPMGEQETADYLAQLEAELATPTPMPQVTPEPIGPDSTSAYAKLIKDKVNLRRTPSSSGTSLDRVPVGTLLLVLGSEYDGTNTWYQVTYNDHEGYIRSDMAQMLTIAQLEAHFQEQLDQAQQASKPGASVTPNKNNNTDIVINGSQLQDLIPVDNSWTNNVVSGMPIYATATPDPNATPTPVPPQKAAALIRSSGDITVYNVPALTSEASFAVYGKTSAYTTITATVEMPMTTLPTTIGSSLISTAIAENTVKRTVGQAISDVNGKFEMNVTLPQTGEYIVEFTTANGSYAQYGVTYDTGATPMPTLAPMPTAAPVEEEDSGLGVWPFVIGGVLIVVAAAVYGVYVYRRRREEEEEDEDDEDFETEMRQAQLNMQRQRAASSASTAPTSTVIPGAQRMPKAPSTPQTQTPSYMKSAEQSPYARPAAPQAPAMPKAPAAPQAPIAPKAPVMPQAPVAPKAPAAPQAPVAPKAPAVPQAPATPQETPADAADTASVPRRRRRPPTDLNA